MNIAIEKKISNIKIIVMDFDGIHTDGYVYVLQDGSEAVRCSRKDGLGMELLKNAGVKMVVISKETNSVVQARCNKLGIDCFRGVADSRGKKDQFEALLAVEQISAEEALFIGDDINDIEVISIAGVGVTVSDAHHRVKEIADIILDSRGGEHAIRELAEIVLAAKGIPIVL